MGEMVTPRPSRFPFTQLHSNLTLPGDSTVPRPCGKPSRKSPTWNETRSGSISLPWPSIRPATHSPTYVLPSERVRWPNPVRSPLTRGPIHFDGGSVHVSSSRPGQPISMPSPCRSPISHVPSYVAPEEYLQQPTPWGMPSIVISPV
eukprot:scaffold265113_cov32-Tisochrysis_lutea.AAC.3